MDIRLPNLGEGADSGSVVTIAVKIGDRIVKDQIVIELENEKAVAAIPSPTEGVVEKIYVKIGDKVAVGQPVLSVVSAVSSVAGSVAPKAPPAPVRPVQTDDAAEKMPFHEAAAAGSSPTIRRMAQALGIDLAQVRASGPGGRITSEDLKAYVASLKAKAASTPPAPSAPAAAAQTAPIDYAKWGPVRIEPLSALRQTVSRRMTEAWTTIPHVTQHEWTDVTRLLARRKVLAEDYRKRGAHLTVTAVLVPILVEVLKKYPVFNSSLDSIGARMIFKDYYHVGIAVDTPAGLMVPVIKNADKLSLEQICVQIETLAEKARQRKVTAEELKGGTFTITNIGGIGGGFFTPIINIPQSAILGIGKASVSAAPAAGQEPRWLMPISLSYDHRIIDGADGARFVKDLTGLIEKADF